MRENIGMFIVEQVDGSIGVQFYADADKGLEVFTELTGKAEQKPHRATYVVLDWQGKKIEARSKDLPVLPEDPNTRPDGWRLGEGPIHFPKKVEDKKKT